MNMLNASDRQIFIVGMNGSGTTMLLEALSKSPDVYGFPYESRIIPYLISRARHMDLSDETQLRRLFDVGASHPIIERANHGKPVPFDPGLLQTDNKIRGIIDGIFMYFARQQGKRIWCEKSPQNIQAIDAILETFPNARIIHMIRDGRDCAASLNRRWKRNPYLIVDRWKNVVRHGIEACNRHADSCLQIKYEDLVSSPEKSIRAICDFSGIDFDPMMLKSSMPWVENTAGNDKITFSGYKWPKYFSQQQIVRLEKLSGKALQELGYDTTLQGESSLPKPYRITARVIDYLRSYFQEIYLKLIGKNDKAFKTILSMPIVSFYEFLVKKH